MPSFLKFLVFILCSFGVSVGVLSWIQGPESSHLQSFVPGRIRVGSILPPFEVQALSLTELTAPSGSFEAFEKEAQTVNVLHFWATWCSVCMDEMPALIQLWERYRHRGLKVFSINLDDHPERVLPPLALPFLHLAAHSLPQLFQVQSIPSTLILNSQRVVLHLKQGPYDWSSQEIHEIIENWLTALHS